MKYVAEDGKILSSKIRLVKGMEIYRQRSECETITLQSHNGSGLWFVLDEEGNDYYVTSSDLIGDYVTGMPEKKWIVECLEDNSKWFFGTEHEAKTCLAGIINKLNDELESYPGSEGISWEEDDFEIYEDYLDGTEEEWTILDRCKW